MIEREKTIEALREAAAAMRSVSTSTTDELRAIARAKRALEAAQIERLALLEQTREHEDEGSSSIATWAKLALREDTKSTRAMLKAGATLTALPGLSAAVEAGEVSLEHLRAFTFGLNHLGADLMATAQDWLIELARTCEPALVMDKIRALRAAVFPDELDRAWAKGMSKRDVKLAKTIDGWVLTGFLDIETGAAFKLVLDSLSAPRDGDDERDAAERRIDALADLFASILDAGALPTDNGVKPHLNVIVGSDALRAALAPTPEGKADVRATNKDTTLPGMPPLARAAVQPAHLIGFGPVGPQLLAYLTCQSDLTPILVDSISPNSPILDVGRSSRLARLPQRRAIHARQAGVCAAPGCSHPIRHIHHVVWWSRGGRTDLAHLIGLCSSCHRLVHAEKLHIDTGPHDSFTFSNARGHPIRGRDDLHTVKTLTRLTRAA
ncbi:DUF222 domain-containing protein [Aeromicrobium sp. CF4.19]|uniref:HNH endonuclease signature motif containing protein n=1 Tax=Aeromicrobium sp. CF4.19 TaxID=3373082 RepID=UPI003EE4FC42